MVRLSSATRVNDAAVAISYNGFERLQSANASIMRSTSTLLCEPSSSFQCTDACAAAAKCRAFIMPTRFATSFSPFMNDIALRMSTLGWHVMNTSEFIMQTPCTPDVLAFYILNPAPYDNVVAWYKSFLGPSSADRTLAGAVWMLLVEDVVGAPERYVLRKAGAWFDGLLARYPESTVSQLTGHYHIKPKRGVINFPHAASRSFWRPVSFEAKNQSALLSGEAGQDYPLRVAALSLLATGLVQRRMVTTRTARFSDPQKQAGGYADTISRFHIAIAGCRQFRKWLWPVAKHFEIMAAGTAMLTDADAAQYLQPLGLLPGVHYLESSPNALNQTLRYWLAPEQRGALRQITARGHRVVTQYHMGDARARHLHQVASALWASKNPTPPCQACANRLNDSTPGAPCALHGKRPIYPARALAETAKRHQPTQ